ncbi:MAG: glutamyl-tRNA reductase [Gemmatimonadaceae bacterium]
MLISLAVDYRFADVSTREFFHFSPDRLERLYAKLDRKGREEIVAVQTCNRSELYVWQPVESAEELDEVYWRLARRWMGSATGARQLLGAARRRQGREAVEHLFRVAAGVESQVLGDGQLLGQLRDAYRQAAVQGGARSVLHRFFERALHVGKRVRSETGLSSGRHSVGAEAAAVVARRFGSLGAARVVIVGCGKTGERAARQLIKLGARDLVLINRTIGRAEQLAHAVRGRAAPIEALYGELALADAAVIATSATAPIVVTEPLAAARRDSHTEREALLLVDLSMPRNVEPSAAEESGVVIVDLDALRPVLAAAERERMSSVPEAEEIVQDELADFMSWVAAASAREAIRPLRKVLENVCYREVSFASGDDVAQRTVERIVAKVLARPMIELRGALLRGEQVDALTGSLMRLFDQPGYADQSPHVTASAS